MEARVLAAVRRWCETRWCSTTEPPHETRLAYNASVVVPVLLSLLWLARENGIRTHALHLHPRGDSNSRITLDRGVSLPLNDGGVLVPGFLCLFRVRLRLLGAVLSSPCLGVAEPAPVAGHPLLHLSLRSTHSRIRRDSNPHTVHRQCTCLPWHTHPSDLTATSHGPATTCEVGPHRSFRSRFHLRSRWLPLASLWFLAPPCRHVPVMTNWLQLSFQCQI